MNSPSWNPGARLSMTSPTSSELVEHRRVQGDGRAIVAFVIGPSALSGIHRQVVVANQHLPIPNLRQRFRNQRKVLRLRNPHRSGDKPHLMVFRTLHKAACRSRVSLVADRWKAQVPLPKQRSIHSYACVRSKFTLKRADKTSKKAVQVQGRRPHQTCGSA